MKTPEQALREYALGSIQCFRRSCQALNTPHNWHDFKMCCFVAQQQFTGVKACCWMILKQHFDANAVRQFQAYNILDSDLLANILYADAFSLSTHLEQQTQNFFSVRNLFRFATEEEIAQQFEAMDKSFCQNVKKSTLQKLTRLLKKWNKTRVVNITANTKSMRYRLSTERNNVAGDIYVSDARFEKYLSVLCGYPVQPLNIDCSKYPVTIFVRQKDAFSPKTLKVELTSLVTLRLNQCPAA